MKIDRANFFIPTDTYLQDLGEIAPGAFCASMGAVARLNADIIALGESPPVTAIGERLERGRDNHLFEAITALRDKLAQQGQTNTINPVYMP